MCLYHTLLPRLVSVCSVRMLYDINVLLPDQNCWLQGHSTCCASTEGGEGWLETLPAIEANLSPALGAGKGQKEAEGVRRGVGTMDSFSFPLFL